MKITVYTLTSNTVENGLESEVFTKEKDLKRAQIAIMTPGEDDDSEFATDITEMLKDGEIEEAWEYWEENVKSEKDTYLIDSQEIEVEVPVANAAAKTAKPVKKR
jgi:aspartate/glutamate racemase